MQAAIDVAQRMAERAPEVMEQPRAHVTPLRYAYGAKKRRSARNASQAKGLYGISASIITNGGPSEWIWHVLASGPKRALELVNIWIQQNGGVYSKRKVERICGVTAGTKERIL